MRRAFLALLVVLVLPGCYAMDLDARAMEPYVFLTPEAARGPSPERIADFDTRLTSSWALWGLVDLEEPALESALEREIDRLDGNGVTNLVVVTQTTFLDGFLSILTLGLYSRRSTFLSGTVVR